MKKIELQQLHLVNFKGLRDLKIDFTSRTAISGANGTGKTTVFDAFTWLLFGKDSADRKTFNIKTLGNDGKPLERLPHEVAALVAVTTEQGMETVTLHRRYVEKWVKKRGSATEEFTGHEEERLYNDVPMSVKDWQSKIAALCDEQVFKFITNPLYFTAQKADVQRAMLFRMAGEVSDQQIAEGNTEFAALLAQLTGKTMDEYKREIAAKKRRLKAEIEAIPERIDERKRDVPQSEDWEALENELQQVTKAYNQSLNLFSAADAAMQNVAEQRKALRTKCNALETQRAIVSATVREQVGKQYNEQSAKQNALLQNASVLERNISDAQRYAAECNAELERCAGVRETLLAEWHTINAEQLQVADGEFICPTCHRRYEVAEVEARMEELTAQFNLRKAQRLADNNAKGKANKAHMDEVRNNLEEAKARAQRFAEQVTELKQDPLFAAKLVAPDYEQAITADAEWQRLSKEIAELESQLAQPMQEAQPADKSQLEQYTAQIDSIKARLAKRSDIERNEKRIAELENSLRTQSQELAELEGIEFTMQQFAKARVEAVEGRINALFGMVRFKLFEQQINGGEVETCVATVGGVPYPDLNNAMKINAGLDIINAISQFEDIAAPIFIDNAEAVNQLLPMRSQVVRLVVTTDKELTVTSEDN